MGAHHNAWNRIAALDLRTRVLAVDNECKAVFLGVGGNLFVLGSPQTNFTNIEGLVAEALDGSRRRPGHIGNQQEAHGGRLARQWMVLLLFDQFPGELQRRSDVLQGQRVFPLNVLEAHAPGQAADD